MKQKQIPRVVIAATQSGSGKTTIVSGLLALLRERGLRVQSYKIGPDYIDPGYHVLASGLPSHNLDTWLVNEATMTKIFANTFERNHADLAIIEGVMGLFDGGQDGISSTASIAKKLNAPVILVINAKSMGESAAAVACGFRDYDKEINFAGVILNCLGSDTHEKMIREALQKRGIEVFGAIKRNQEIILPERHLGLLPVEENEATHEKKIIAKIAEHLKNSLALEKILDLAKSAPLFEVSDEKNFTQEKIIRLGVAKDEAFSFYYPESLSVLEKLGAELIFFSPLHDEHLPKNIDGLFFGGGFPEMFAQKLFENQNMRAEIFQAGKKNLPIYAECGGYMYLKESLKNFEGNIFEMVGLIPGKTRMTKKLQTVGYVKASFLKDNFLGKKGEIFHGHEFHFSEEIDADETSRAFLFEKRRGHKKELAGFLSEHIFGSYLHLHFAGAQTLAKNFVRACQKFRQAQI